MNRNSKRTLKANVKKGAAITLAGTMLVTGIAFSQNQALFTPVNATRQVFQINKQQAVTALHKADKETLSNLLSSASDNNVDKDETVYVKCEADGSIQNITVSDWLKNKDKSATIKDSSILENIKNVKGDEKSTGSGADMSWTANGKEIYYQGTTDEDLPVDVKVTYQLDGKDITAKELVGKSGKVTIRFDYKNKEKRTVNVDGKNYTVNVPFAMVSGMLLPTENFSNVEVTNGKCISDGDKAVVVGCAMPGLKDSLNFSSTNFNSDDFDIPDYVEVTADVTDFELSMTMSAAVPDLLSNINIDDIDSVDDLKNALDDLQDATNQLIDGSGTLKDGLNTLNSKSGTLVNGISTLNSKSKQFKTGVASLTTNTVALKNGAKKVDTNMKALSNGASELSKKAKAAQPGINQLKTGSASLKKGASAVRTAVGQLNTAITTSKDAKQPALKTAITAAAQGANDLASDTSGLGALKAATSGLPDSTAVAQFDGGYAQVKPVLEAMQSQYTALANAETDPAKKAQYAGQAKALATSLALLSNSKPLVDGAPTLKAGIAQAANGAKTLSGGLGQIKTGVDTLSQKVSTFYTETATLKNGAEQLDSGIGTLKSSYSKLVTGASTLSSSATKLQKEGTGAISGNLAKLNSGTAKINTATGQLTKGIGTLATAAPQLKSGVQKLSDGAKKLNSGLIQFNKDGIQKLSSTGDDLKDVLAQLKAIKKAGESYKTFSGLADGQKGSVKFLIETAGITKDE